jgi:hypothetical protein
LQQLPVDIIMQMDRDKDGKGKAFTMEWLMLLGLRRTILGSHKKILPGWNNG